MGEFHGILLENDKLRDELEVQKREYQRIIEESKDNIGVTRANKPSINIGVEGAISQERPSDSGEGSNPGLASVQVIMELKNRAHLLTEENQVLFQQISVLRSHYDQFNKEHDEKVEEMNF